MRPASRRAIRLTLKIGLTLVATYFLFSSLRVSWGEIGSLGAADWRPRTAPLLASLAVLLTVFFYLVALWSRLVGALGGPTLTLPVAMEVFFLANLGRYVPGKVWQLASLAYLAGRKGVSLGVSSSAAILAQLFSLGAAFSVALAFLVLEGFTPLPRSLLPWALVPVGAIVIVISIPSVTRQLLRLAFRLGRDSSPQPEVGSWFGFWWLSLHLPAWIGYGLAFGLLWSAFPDLPPVSWVTAIGSFAAAYFLGYAAIFAPAGIGVREGIMAVLLAPLLGAASAAILSVVARIWMTLGELVPLVAIVGGAGLRRMRGDVKRPENAV